MNAAADNAAALPPAAAAPIAAPAAAAPAPAPPGAIAAAQNVAPNARVNRMPRRDNLAPSTATVTGIPPMYQLVATAPFYTVQQRTINKYVPSFIACSLVINEMNYHMAYTHRFLQGAPAWLPHMSQLYFGILFLVQTLRAQREAGTISHDQLWLLEGLTNMYDLRSLLIPGPIVPHFQALSASSAPHEWLGDITPFLPEALSTAANVHLLGDNLHWILPNIPAYLDILQAVAASTADYTQSSLAMFFTHTFGETASANASTRHHLNSPSVSHVPSYSLQQINTARHALANIHFPPKLNTTDGDHITNWQQYMRMYSPDGNFFPWFPSVASIMQRYCQFFDHTVPLSAIAPAGIASGSIIWTFARNTSLATRYTLHRATTTPAVAAYYEPHTLHSIAATGKHSDELLEEVTEQNSAIAQVNIDLSHAGLASAPANAAIRSGPLWAMTAMRQSPQIDYALGISTVITTAYHTDTRANRR